MESSVNYNTSNKTNIYYQRKDNKLNTIRDLDYSIFGIGIGTTGKCQFLKTINSKTNKTLFVKKYSEIKKLIAYKEIFINERLGLVKHKNIVGYNDHTNNDKGEVSLNFEFCENGNLFDFCYTDLYLMNTKGKYSLMQKMVTQIVKGLIAIHKQGIIHNDLKLENILVFKNKYNEIVVKIADFNNSLLFDGNEVTYLSDEDYYMSSLLPFYFETPSFQYDYLCLGIIIYQLMFFKSPFEFRNKIEFVNKLKSFNDNFDFKGSSLCIMKDLIQQLLVFDNSQRLNDSNILDHPFFRNKTINKIDFLKKKRLRIKTKVRVTVREGVKGENHKNTKRNNILSKNKIKLLQISKTEGNQINKITENKISSFFNANMCR